MFLLHLYNMWTLGVLPRCILDDIDDIIDRVVELFVYVPQLHWASSYLGIPKSDEDPENDRKTPQNVRN